MGHHRGGIDPHDEQRRPAEELDEREPLHHRRHAREIAHEIAEDARPGHRGDHPGEAIGGEQAGQQIELLLQLQREDQRPQRRAADQPGQARADRGGRGRMRGGRRLSVERRDLLGRIFAGGEHGPQHGEQQRRAAQIEAPAHRIGQGAADRDIGHTAPVEQPGRGRSDHRAGADERRLDRIAGGVLAPVEHVADKCAERLHRDVERRIEHPEQQHRGEQHRRIGHGEQRQRRQHRAGQEIGSPAAKAAPGPVRIMADDRLDEQPGQRGGDPQQRQIVNLDAQRLEDTAHVRILQREADLDAEEAEADVPQPDEPLARPPPGRSHRRRALAAGATKRIASPPPGASAIVSVSPFFTGLLSIVIAWRASVR